MKKKMTVADIEARVEAIKPMIYDGEKAHTMQDELYEDVLKAISERNCVHAQECAKTALKVKKLDFSRWYS